MLFRKGRQWELSPYKIKYTQHGETHSQFAHDKKWWLDFADTWEHTKIIEIVDVEYTIEQLERYVNIKHMPEDFGDIYSEYVLNGNLPSESVLHINHPLQILRLRTENLVLRETVEILENRQDTTDPLVERIKTATEIYEENKDKTDILIEDLKLLKIGMLKEQCSEAIYAGFTVQGMHFGFGEFDQQNMTQQLLLVVSGDTSPIQWKTRNLGVVELTPQQFAGIAQAAKTHKMTEQSKYWALEQLVTAATSKDEIKTIKW